MIGVYLHIPFCRTRCPYCDFVSNAIPGHIPDTFINALIDEIASFEGPNNAASFFFGGGTPSLLTPDQLNSILGALHKRFDDSRLCEITIEANPDDVTSELADAWRQSGINRVSLGVQSFDDAVLNYLGRRHSARQAHLACEIIAERFDNWSMDLIFGAYPVETWDKTLDACIAHRPRHVSAYGLTYEDGTPFGSRKSEAIESDVSLELYHLTEERLSGESRSPVSRASRPCKNMAETAMIQDEAARVSRPCCHSERSEESRSETVTKPYIHYEISNFAQPGYECRHNLIYWHNEAYAGFGPAAYSFLNGIRAKNETLLEVYIATPGYKTEAIHLTDREIRIETLIQHFRLKSGLEKSAYHARFGSDVRNDFASALATLISRGMLIEDAHFIRPTPLGFDLNNEIGLAIV